MSEWQSSQLSQLGQLLREPVSPPSPLPRGLLACDCTCHDPQHDSELELCREGRPSGCEHCLLLGEV